MQDFAAIDFETANYERSSVCSVGVVIVRGGEIVDKFYSLIKPEPEHYTFRCSMVRRRYGECPRLPGRLEADRTHDSGPPPRGPQQGF